MDNEPPGLAHPDDVNDADDPVEDDEVDPARAALADAQRLSRTTSPRRTRGSRQTRRRIREQNLDGRPQQAPRASGYSAAGPDPDRDPLSIGSVLSGYVVDRGWDRPIAEGRVFADWATLVGPDVAAHCSPQSLRDGELRVAAESTAWASQLRLLSATLLARLVAELGPHVVTRLLVSGPSGPSWKHGAWSVRGARGPRDTYG